jgi:gluconate 5-dehydrogenase
MSTKLFSLEGRRALVTGSSQGLGLVMARGLAEAGATVILNGRTEDKLAAAADSFSRDGLKAETSAFDVTDPEGAQTAIASLGRIDILMNNAGIHRRSPLAEMSVADWRAVIDTNLGSAFYVTRAVVKQMIERKAGKIINICSVNSEIGRPTIGNYTASKGGLKMLTKAMALEWGAHNIQTNGIGPGYMITDMTKPLVEDPKFNAWICGRTPLGRWGDPDDLKGAAIFLASKASDYMTGQILYVDGGILSAV